MKARRREEKEFLQEEETCLWEEEEDQNNRTITTPHLSFSCSVCGFISPWAKAEGTQPHLIWQSCSPSFLFQKCIFMTSNMCLHSRLHTVCILVCSWFYRQHASLHYDSVMFIRNKNVLIALAYPAPNLTTPCSENMLSCMASKLDRLLLVNISFTKKLD